MKSVANNAHEVHVKNGPSHCTQEDLAGDKCVLYTMLKMVVSAFFKFWIH